MTRSLFALSPATILATLTTLVASPAANAQATLSYAGGSGTPLTLTIASPVTYTVTINTDRLIFVFDAAGNNFIPARFVFGTLTYTINGGTAQTFDRIASGGSSSDVTTNDTYLIAGLVPSSAGDTVVLTAGTLTTTDNFDDPAPTGGTFTAFITNGEFARVSNNGVAGAITAPEPASLALLVLPIAGLIMRRKRFAP